MFHISHTMNTLKWWAIRELSPYINPHRIIYNCVGGICEIKDLKAQIHLTDDVTDKPNNISSYRPQFYEVCSVSARYTVKDTHPSSYVFKQYFKPFLNK